MHSPVIRRFLDYIQIDTRSVLPEKNTENPKPSSIGQITLGNLIKQELAAWDIPITEFADGSFMAHLPATEGCTDKTHAAFAAHLDTYYGVNGLAHPIIHIYQGGDLALPNNDAVIPASDLADLEGKHIITSDGTSLLGGDDKAGVAAMVTVLEELHASNPPHGPLTFWFCVDEEVGELDIHALPKKTVESWDILWTIDGERVGPIDVGCMFMRAIDIVFTGMDFHPGVQGDKLRPAHFAAAVFLANMADLMMPWESHGLESFFYANTITGTASSASIFCTPRAFDRNELDEMFAVIEQLAREAAMHFECDVQLNDKVVCINTRPSVTPKMHLVEPCVEAHKQFGFTSTLHDVRGGTDGAMINMIYPELPAPNMGTGSTNLHSPQEFAVLEELELVPKIVLALIGKYAA